MTPTPRKRVALVDYPSSQKYILNLLLPALANALPEWKLTTSRKELEEDEVPDLQWSDYDEIDWDILSGPGGDGRMANSYVIRKSLIRKNHLAHTLSMYLAKNPKTTLRSAVLKSFTFQLSFPDELDELLQDDLYELAEAFEEDAGKNADETRWWILKAALADKGQGIRLFSTRQMLEDIFEEFEEDYESSDEDNEQREGGQGGVRDYQDATRVSSSQMREWVIQEYVASPLLLDPTPGQNLTPRKFHLRVYVVAVGGLTVYVHQPFLALFASKEYIPPEMTAGGKIDLTSHLTNTCLQETLEIDEKAGVAVRTLQDMADNHMLCGSSEGETLSRERIERIERRVAEIVAETFRAGVLPNCFEIFGLDFLVDSKLEVFLLEINACPDFTQTGIDLQAVISRLFEDTVKVAVSPLFSSSGETVSELKSTPGVGLKKVLEMQVSRAW